MKDNPKLGDVADVMRNVDYYEGHPDGFDVYSWSPAPASDPSGKLTQVHLHAHIGDLGRVVVRFKGPNTLDRLIAALLEHRANVWGQKK